MIHPKLSLRRPLAVAGAALMGLAAATAIAAPASAHQTAVTGSAPCVTASGDWQVNWSVANSEADITGTVVKVRSTTPNQPLTGITVNAVLPKKNDGTLTGVQTLTKNQQRTKLTVGARWVREGRHQNQIINHEAESAWVNKPTKVCATPTSPSPSVSPSVSPSTSASPTPSATPSTPATPSPSVSPSTPATPTPSASTTPPAPVTPETSVQSTCDELTYAVTNPEGGKTVTVTVTPSKGEAKTLTVEPGKSGSVSFPAEEGLTVTPSGEGVADTTPVAWEKPEGCDSGAGGGDLPLTGAAAGGIAAGALVLLAIGVTLFLVARRRRLTFTA
ncbi:cell wall anchor protein [Micromonospora sp. NPDC050417]|uniref:cell wall anchor protein n=1 Tax=Micromonospora sp. NPDC050417 TaxID=3364280 RepID=UPI0037981C5A